MLISLKFRVKNAVVIIFVSLILSTKTVAAEVGETF